MIVVSYERWFIASCVIGLVTEKGITKQTQNTNFDKIIDQHVAYTPNLHKQCIVLVLDPFLLDRSINKLSKNETLESKCYTIIHELHTLLERPRLESENFKKTHNEILLFSITKSLILFHGKSVFLMFRLIIGRFWMSRMPDFLVQGLYIFFFFICFLLFATFRDLNTLNFETFREK